MAVYKIFPTKDATIYSEQANMNAGLDEILECSSYIKNDTPQVSRYLMKFSSTGMNDILDNKIGSALFKVNIRNFSANTTGLTLDNKLYFYPISGSWAMGTGKYQDSSSVEDGVSWNWRTYSGSSAWPTAGFEAYTTASFSTAKPGGGVWYTGSSLGLNVLHTQSFNYPDSVDVNIDVTDTILTWYSGSLPNEGFIVKQPNEFEFVNNRNNDTYFKYFSIDTHTIYPPELEFKWDDYSFSTGSSTNTILTTPSALISIYNNVGTYYSGSVSKFRIEATPKYPTRTFMTSSLYTTNYYLPESSSLYAIKDSATNEMIVDFDTDYTRINADVSSSYFTLYPSGLEPERNYSVMVKIEIDGEIIIFDEDLIFKVKGGITFDSSTVDLGAQ